MITKQKLAKMKEIDRIVIHCLRRKLFKQAISIMKEGASIKLVNMIREGCVKRGYLYMYLEIARNVPGSRIPRREELRRIALVNLCKGEARQTLQALAMAKCSLLSAGCSRLAANMRS